MNEPRQLDEIKASTKQVYERNAGYWNDHRSQSLYEKSWLDRFIAILKPGGRVLDLGCGTGVPIANYFLVNDFKIVGVDYSQAMIRIAKSLFPAAEWLVGDMTSLPIVGAFDGLYSWDGFFHLSVEEQRVTLPKLSGMVKPGGALLITVGTDEGEVTGTVGSETIYHASLAVAEYEEILRSCGFEIVVFKANDPECRGRSVLLGAGRVDP